MPTKITIGVLAVTFCSLQALSANTEQQTTKPSEHNSDTEILVSGKPFVSKWFRAESPRLIVYSDTTQEDVTQLLDNLERLDYLLRIYMRIDDKTDIKEKLTIYYYQYRMGGLKDIDKDQPDYAIGLYSSCPSGVQGFGVHLNSIANLNDKQLEKHPLNDGLSYMFEAYARHFLYRYTNIRTPAWFIDGFAQYFASTRFSDNQMIIGKAPTSIGAYLEFLSDGHRYSLDYKDVLEQNVDKKQNYAGTAGVALELKAKSWILTHYMLSSNENSKHLHDYLRMINSGISASEAFKQAFGYNVSKIDHELWKYRNSATKATILDVPPAATINITFSSLPLAADDLLLADAALKACPNRNAGEALLQNIQNQAKRFPNSNYAQLILSRAQIDWGNAQDAIAYLSKVEKSDAANFESAYLLGLAQLRLAERQSDASRQTYLNAARRHFLHAISLNPQSSEAAYALYRSGTMDKDEPNERALGGALVAWENAHEVDTFAKSAALVYAYLGRTSEAQNALALIAQNTRNPELTAWAKTLQARLRQGITRSEIAAEMRLDPVSNTRFKEWTIANEDVMQAIKKSAGTEGAQNLIDDQARTEQGYKDR